MTTTKKIARMIYEIYTSVVAKLIAKIVAVILWTLFMILVVVGPEIENEEFDKISVRFTVIVASFLLLLYLLYKWAEYQIKDELKEEGLIEEEEMEVDSDIKNKELERRVDEYLRESLQEGILRKIYNGMMSVIGWIVAIVILVSMAGAFVWYIVELLKLIIGLVK